MVHNPEIQENEVMELDMCHVLVVDSPSRRGKQDEVGGKGSEEKVEGKYMAERPAVLCQ